MGVVTDRPMDGREGNDPFPGTLGGTTDREVGRTDTGNPRPDMDE